MDLSIVPSTRHPKISRALYRRKVKHNLNVCVDRERVNHPQMPTYVPMHQQMHLDL